MGSPRETKIRLERRRWLCDLARRARKREFHRSREKPCLIMNEANYRSEILDLFSKGLEGAKRSWEPAPKKFALPRTFSLTENAEDSLRVLRDIVRYARLTKRTRLVLDHRPIKELGLGAEVLLAVILKEISKELEFVPGAYIKGHKPTSQKIKDMMSEIGCVRVLGSGFDDDIQVSIKSTASVYRHQNRGKQLLVDPMQRDLIARTCGDFSDHVDKCLNKAKKRLTPSGREKLTSHMGEVLINAQEHSGTAQWLVTGYLDGADKDLVYRAVILSFGHTIAANFEATEADSVPAMLVKPYIEIHEKKRLFGQNWTKSDLLSVIALQGNISSQLDKGANSDRGQGTVDLIEFFQDMSEACTDGKIAPVMSLLTGRTHIRFDGKYRMKYEQSVSRMVIAFNENNTLSEPPDPLSVYRLQGEGFPGVAVSIMVPLAQTAVEDIPGDHS